MEIETGRLSYQFVHGRLTQQTAPPGFVRAPYDDMANAVSATEIQQRVDGFFGAQAHDFCSEIPRALFVFQEMTLQCRVNSMVGFLFRLHMNDKPVRV